MSWVGYWATVLLLAAAVSVSCGTGEQRFSGTLDTTALLVQDPELPSTILKAQQGGGVQPEAVEWRESYRLRRGLPDQSSVLGEPGVEEVGRGWTTSRRPDPGASIWQAACGFPAESAARDRWEDVSVFEVLPEKDWDFLEPENSHPAQWTPRLVVADDAELICLSGDGDGVCGDWAYFARYGRYFVLSMARVGLSYAQFLRFVRSIDTEIALRALQRIRFPD